MDLEDHAVIPIVERALAMTAVGRESWCMEWAQWLWSQEIEVAVCEAKQTVPQRRPRRRQLIAADISPTNVHLTSGPNDEALSPGGLVHPRTGELPPE